MFMPVNAITEHSDNTTYNTKACPLQNNSFILHERISIQSKAVITSGYSKQVSCKIIIIYVNV